VKDLQWLGSSKKDLMKFPEDVRQEMGYAIYVAQKGDTYKKTKPFKGFGSGVYEITIEEDTNAYRSVYIVNIADKVYVVHCFKKKSKKGIETPKEELVVIKERLTTLKLEMLKKR
jgi:phage-related protein